MSQKILVVNSADPDQAVQDIAAYVHDGTLGPTVHLEDLEAYMAIGRVEDCTCGLISCVCNETRNHAEGCAYRTSMLCPVGIECDHGFDVCPQCDACTCGAG